MFVLRKLSVFREIYSDFKCKLFYFENYDGNIPMCLVPAPSWELLMRKLCLQPGRGVLKFQFSLVAIGSKVGIYCYSFTIKYKY